MNHLSYYIVRSLPLPKNIDVNSEISNWLKTVVKQRDKDEGAKVIAEFLKTSNGIAVICGYFRKHFLNTIDVSRSSFEKNIISICHLYM